MTSEPFYINAVYEDVISLAVIKRLLQCSPRPLLISLSISKNGSSYITDNIRKFHKAAQIQPFIILLDADNETCALTLLNKTIPKKFRHSNCIFRIVVREIEAWLLADSVGISTFLGVNCTQVPQNVEQIPDPKQLIVNLASKSKKRIIRGGIVPSTSARIGPEYNHILCQFVNNHWNIDRAVKNSESLRRALAAVNRLASSL